MAEKTTNTQLDQAELEARYREVKRGLEEMSRIANNTLKRLLKADEARQIEQLKKDLS